MRPILTLLFPFSLLLSCESARESVRPDQVPTAVRQSFTAVHSDTKVEWKVESDGSYEAEYNLDGEESSAKYAADGKLLETEMEIKKKALPAAVLAAIAAQFPDHEIEEAARITYPDGRVVYEAELEGDDDVKFDAIFSADGTLVERISLSDDDND